MQSLRSNGSSFRKKKDCFNSYKGIEIEAWLRQYPKPNASYVIIEDESVVLPEQRDHFVQAKPELGLSEQDAERAIQILLNKLTFP